MKHSLSLRAAAFVASLVASLAVPTGPAVAQDDVAVRASVEVLDALRAGDLAAIEARFDAKMKEAFPHETFVATARQVDGQVGAMQACRFESSRAASGGTGVTVVAHRCDFERAPLLVRLAWSGAGELAGLFYAPLPAEPAPAVALPDGVRELSLTAGAPGWPLPATLSLPDGVARPPVVVLVHGSGPNDRDETIGPNKPFRDLAFGLATRGIASLRYEKRTRALGPRFVAEVKNPTLDDEVVDDAVAALALLAQRDDVGPVYVVGHSLGAWLAPRIAATAARRDLRVAGVVMLAANLTPLADLVVRQYEFLAALPQPSATAAMVDDAKARRANVARLIAGDFAAAPLLLDAPVSMWRDLGTYDPAAMLLAEPRLPALLVFGGRDYQVPIDEKARWDARLSGRAQTTSIAFATVNHLMIEGSGPMTPVEYDVAGHVAQPVIERVARWIAAQ